MGSVDDLGSRARPTQPKAPHGVSMGRLAAEICPKVSWRTTWPGYPVARSGFGRLDVLVGRPSRNAREKTGPGARVLPCRLPGSYPGARAPKKDDGRGRPVVTTGVHAVDTHRPWAPAEHAVVAVHLAVAGAWAVLCFWGVTL